MVEGREEGLKFGKEEVQGITSVLHIFKCGVAFGKIKLDWENIVHGAFFLRYSIFFFAFRPSKLNTTYNNKPDSPHVLRDRAGLRRRVKVPVRERALQLPELPAALAREAIVLLHGVAEQGVAQGGEALERGKSKLREV